MTFETGSASSTSLKHQPARASRPALRYWLLVLFWMLLIFWGSTESLSSARTSRFIRPILTWLHPNVTDTTVQLTQLIIRKAGHLTEYAILAAFLYHAASRTPALQSRAWPLAFLVAILYAASDEWHQSFEPTRMGSAWDVAIDAAGAALGLAAVRLILCRNRRRRSPSAS